MSIGAYVLIAVLATVVAGILLYYAVRGGRSFLKFRGKRLVTCPQTHKPAAVRVDAARAAYHAAAGATHLKLSQCSRWPEKQGCGQECLRQIERSPEECLVRTIVTRWYAGKACAVCGKLIHEVEWLGHKPALLDADGKTVYWDHMAVEQLPEVFSTYTPVCWDCHIASTLVREHPEVVTHPPWPRERG